MASRFGAPRRPRAACGCRRTRTGTRTLALKTIAAAAESRHHRLATARSYGLGASDLGHNERLLARGLRANRAGATARIVTKGGMTRAGDTWIPDGRAKAIRADCEASLTALDGLPIDLYLVHAPDPRTPWRTSVRALARLVDEGVVKSVGVANVNRLQLDEALELAPISAVQVALSVYDDRALRGAVVERCAEAGVTVIAHSPLGGPRRAGGPRSPESRLPTSLRALAASPAEVALAWLLDLSPRGRRHPRSPAARRRRAPPPTPRGSPSSPTNELLLAAAFGAPRRRLAPQRRSRTGRGHRRHGHPGRREEPHRGAVRRTRLPPSQSRRARRIVTRPRCCTRRGAVVQALAGSFWTTRISPAPARSYVIETANRHGAEARCIWLDTPLAQAQVNLVERLLERFGALPSPEKIQELARREPSVLAPTSQMRALRELEPPSTDEGFAEVETVPFERSLRKRDHGWLRRGHRVGAARLEARARGARPGCASPGVRLEPGRRPGRARTRGNATRRRTFRPVEQACPHAGGPPSCWCRPPLPGLLLEFARARGVAPSRSILVGTSPAHRTLATTLGTRYVDA